MGTSGTGKNRHTVCVDWDGTIVEAKWPAMGDWMPGAREALLRLHLAGAKILVFSARLSPYNPWTFQERDPAELARERFAVRNKLDSAGLHFVDIWTLPGKPGASVYVDDRAERYHGRKGSWRALSDKIMLRIGLEAPELPEFRQEAANGSGS